MMASNDSVQKISCGTAEDPGLIDDIVGEKLSAETFSDLLRKACQDFTLCSTNNANLEQLTDSLQVLQAFVLSTSLDLSLDEKRMVLDLILCACAKIQFPSVVMQACLFLNQWITDEAVWTLINSNTVLRPYVLGIGQRLYKLGDYEIQAQLLETMIRISGAKNREYWARQWFNDPETINMFNLVNPQNFEVECRWFLNYINKSKKGRTVFSVTANKVMLGSIELEKPHGSDLWVDFNYGSKSLSFYCLDPFPDENSSLLRNSLSLWETFTINRNIVSSYSIEQADKFQYLVVDLQISYFELMSSKCISCDSNDGYQFRFEFWDNIDIQDHVQVIFGSSAQDAGEELLGSQEKADCLSQMSSQGSSRVTKASCSFSCFRALVTDVDTPKSEQSGELAVDSMIRDEKPSNENGDDESGETLPMVVQGQQVDKLYGKEAAKSNDVLSPNASLADFQTGNSSKKYTSTQEDLEANILNKDIKRDAHPMDEFMKSDVHKISPINLISDYEHEGNSSGSEEVPPSRTGAHSTPLSRKKTGSFVKSVPTANALCKDIQQVLETDNTVISEDCSSKLQNEELNRTHNQDSTISKEHFQQMRHPRAVDKGSTVGRQGKRGAIKSTKGNEATTLNDTSHKKGGVSKRIRLFKSESAPMYSTSPPSSEASKPSEYNRSSFGTRKKGSTPVSPPATTQKAREKKGAKRTQKTKQNKSSTSRKDEAMEIPVYDVSSHASELQVTEPSVDPGTFKEAENLEDMDFSQKPTKDVPVSTAVDDSGIETAFLMGKQGGFVTLEKGDNVASSLPDSSVEKANQTSNVSSKVTKTKRKAAEISTQKNQIILSDKRGKSSSGSPDIYEFSDTSSFGSPALKKRLRKDDLADANSGTPDVTVNKNKEQEGENVLFHTPVKTYSKLNSSSKRKARPSAGKSSTSKQRGSKKETKEQIENQGKEKFPSDASSIDKFQLTVEKTAPAPHFVRNLPFSTPSSSSMGKPKSIPKRQNRKASHKSLMSGPRSLRKRLPEAASSSSGILPPSISSRDNSPVGNRKKLRDPFASLVLHNSGENNEDLLPTELLQEKTALVQDQYSPDVRNDPLDVAHKMLKDGPERNINGLSAEICVWPDGKQDHLRRYIEDIPLHPPLECEPNNDLEEEQACEIDSLVAVYGSPEDKRVADQTTPDLSGHEEVDSSRAWSNGSMVIHMSDHRQSMRRLEDNFKKILQQYKNMYPSSSSSEPSSSTYSSDDSLFVKDKLIPPGFYDEAESLLKKYINTIQTFTAEFFDKLSDSRRNLFHHLTSSKYEEVASAMAQNILKYQRSNSMFRDELHSELQKIRAAVNNCIQAEEEFDNSFRRIERKCFEKFEKGYREASQGAISKQEAKLINKLRKQLDKLRAKFFHRNKP